MYTWPGGGRSGLMARAIAIRFMHQTRYACHRHRPNHHAGAPAKATSLDLLGDAVAAVLHERLSVDEDVMNARHFNLY